MVTVGSGSVQLGAIAAMRSLGLSLPDAAQDGVFAHGLAGDLAAARPGAIEVTALTFDTAGSQCIAFVPKNYKASDSSTYTQWTTTAGTGRACVAGASGAPVTYPDTATHAFVETRQVNIVLTGRSLTDTALPALTLRESVLLRNNRVVDPP